MPHFVKTISPHNLEIIISNVMRANIVTFLLLTYVDRFKVMLLIVFDILVSVL